MVQQCNLPPIQEQKASALKQSKLSGNDFKARMLHGGPEISARILPRDLDERSELSKSDSPWPASTFQTWKTARNLSLKPDGICGNKKFAKGGRSTR